MTRFDCAAVDEHAPEYALGLLDGETRAAVIAHVDSCPRCRSLVAGLSDAADATLELGPDAEPPADFEQRVLAATAGTERGPRRVGRVLVVAAAAMILAVALVAAGTLYGRRTAPAIEEAVVHRSNNQQSIGRVLLTGEEPSWMFVSLESDSVRGAYACELVLDDGSVVRAGEFDADNGKADWSGTVPVGRSSIREMRVVLSDGRVIATASFE